MLQPAAPFAPGLFLFFFLVPLTPQSADTAPVRIAIHQLDAAS